MACYDANNLYGEAMCAKLPCRDFEWVESELLRNIDWFNVDTEGDDCWILKVDLEYPSNIHDVTIDLPLAPQNQDVTWNMLTRQQKQDYQSMNEQRGQTNKYVTGRRLLQTCSNKQEYVVHFKILKWYLAMGMRITKFYTSIHCIQDCLLKSYIEMNSAKRAATTNTFKKNLFKLLNNAVYGKTMENVRKYVTIKMVTPKVYDPSFKYIKYSSKPEYESTIVYSENLIGLRMTTTCVELNKPIYLGMSILDVSKLIMYKWRYEKLPCALPSGTNLKVVAGDTDSFFVKVTGVTRSEYEKRLCDLQLFRY